MSPKSLEDETLGTKHQKYNQLVKTAIANGETVGKEFVIEKTDLDNLKKIDIAAHNKDIDFIINVLKSGDLLYISRALKQSPWLVDKEYAHIINSQHIKDTLLPQLTTKASIKLLKHIQNNIKDEARAEEFYKNEPNIKCATKLLAKCSLEFIESNIEKHLPHLELLDFVQLCKRSVFVFETAFKADSPMYRYHDYRNKNNRLQATIFLLDTHTDKYLDAVERLPSYMAQRFNAKSTNLIMKKDPERVFNKLGTYLHCLDIPTFVKYIKPEEIKDFIYKHATDEKFFEQYRSVLFRYEIIKHFIVKMPKDQRFAFVKQIFIDKTLQDIDEKTLTPGTVMYAYKRILGVLSHSIPVYKWYKFAPFDIAFPEIKKLMHAESIDTKYRMLKVLIDIAGDNFENLRTILQYYNDQHIKDLVQQKCDFIKHVTTATNVYKFDEKTWHEFDKILNSIDLYTDPKFSDVHAIETVILYNLVNNKPIPDIIVQKTVFYPGCLKKYKRYLGKEECDRIFCFFYNDLKFKVENHSVKDEDSFKEVIDLIEKILDLLNDWDKSISDYPFVLNKIKDMIKIKEDNSWKKDLSNLYNKNKKWRKFMFEESIVLYSTQDACINSLKHDPALLTRYQKQIEALLHDGKTSLKQFHKKLRIYWEKKLTEEWIRSHISRLENSENQTEVVRGLCILLSNEALTEILKKYAPETSKIDWDKTDNVKFSLQIAFAKNMHISRPQPSPDAVLTYAKGDFLQYAIPSLHAIFYNLSPNSSKEHIPKLLSAPVSLRKHGFRFAFLKFDQDILEHHLSNTWKESKNMSIRAVIFKHVFDLICKEKDSEKVKNLWKLLDFFIDNLTFKEDPKIYKQLQEISNVPLSIRPAFLMKSYKFQKDLYNETKNEEYSYTLEMLENSTRDMMKQMDPTFVEEIIKKYIDSKFFVNEKYNGNSMLNVVTSYILTADDEEIQRDRYERVIVPLMKRSFDKWNENDKGDYYVRRKFYQLLLRFGKDLKIFYDGENQMTVPTKIFRNIWNEIQSLPIAENYIILTVWKLILKFAELIELHKTEGRNWDAFCKEITTDIGKTCLAYLKEDVKYFPAIYILFTKAMNRALEDVFDNNVNKYSILEQLLEDKEFHQAYISVIKLIPDSNYHYGDRDKDLELKEANIKTMIREHPSVEVKMHYYDRFGD